MIPLKKFKAINVNMNIITKIANNMEFKYKNCEYFLKQTHFKDDFFKNTSLYDVTRRTRNIFMNT